MGNAIGKERCPRCADNGNDKSGDNLVIYDDGGKVCFRPGCGYTVLSDDYKAKYGGYELVGKPFDESVSAKIRNYTTDPNGFRGLTRDTCTKFRVRHVFNDRNEVVEQYYPATINYELSGYKVRKNPKDFDAYGTTGKACDMFGQVIFRNSNSKTVIITGGELDAMSAYQMLHDYQKAKGNGEFEPVPVVSCTVGEGGTAKQIQAHYEWFSRFDKIILCLDNDEAGKRAAEECMMVLPKGKAYRLDMTLKDPNKYLEEGRGREFVAAYWAAKPIIPAGVIGSDDLYDRVIENVSTECIPLPDFMEELAEMMGGEIPLGYIVNFASASGCVDRDTEFLTPSGWKAIGDYVNGDMVAQYNVDKSISFVKPNEYIKIQCDTLTRVENRSVDQVLSDEHRVVYYATKDSKQQRVITFSEVREKHETLKTGFRGLIANTFEYNGAGIDLTEGELRLQVAVMADGRIVQGGKDNYTQMRFSKKRKYDRIIDLCKKFNLPYKDNGVKSNDGQKGGMMYEVIVWPKRPDKSFSGDYYNCTNDQLKIICDEVVWWDGCSNNNSYSSCRKEDVDFIQFAFSATGHRAVVGEDRRVEKYTGGYCGVVTVNKKCKFTSFAKGGNSKTIFSEYKTKDGFKYCFSVDSGMLLLRRNGRIFVTGNSGKTTIVNEMIYHWIFNCPVPVGVVSMELDAGQYGETMLSRHLGRKISLIPGKQAKLEYLQSEYVRNKARELFRKEDGSPRWHLVDDRDGGLETIQATVEQLIISCGCRVIILDPLQDLLDGLSNEEQAVFMRWQKRMVKSHKVTFINISHVRKNSTGQQANSTGAFLSEEDMSGSSTIFKSGGANVLFGRNKYAEDPVERNTITAVMSKCRWTGLTGPAGQWYYDNIKHTMMSKRKWVEDNNHIPSEEAFAEAENMANKLLSAASALSVGDVEFET